MAPERAPVWKYFLNPPYFFETNSFGKVKGYRYGHELGRTYCLACLEEHIRVELQADATKIRLGQLNRP